MNLPTDLSSLSPIPTVRFPSGQTAPILGQGTWRMGEDSRNRKKEIESLRYGVELGMTLIDTAEMYGEGKTEELVGEALKGIRHEVFLVSKFYPHHASPQQMKAACEASLKRLKTDHLDLYLLHWRGDIPLGETLEGFEALLDSGKILSWGVSNFSLDDMTELTGLPDGEAVNTNQILYNLTRRGIEWDLLPWSRQRGIPLMAYSPIEQGLLLGSTVLKTMADRYNATPAQIALAWVLRQQGIIAIPKAGHPKHVEENRTALEIHLTANDLAELDQAFPAPKGPVGLEML